jgi:hypothetical protein
MGNDELLLVTDVIYALRRRGRPIYGFEPVSSNFSRVDSCWLSCGYCKNACLITFMRREDP